MKVKNIYKYLVVSLGALLLGSCTSTEVDSDFDQNATERLSGRQKELNDLLLSSAEGWKAVYYTDSTQLGGWTHLMKFLPEGKVDMASDFTIGTDTDTKTYTSQYEIQMGSTVSLVFTTQNRIHLLSDAGNSPTASLLAKGYLGDFQFYYYGQKDGDILFRTNRNGHFLRFIKATAQDWADLSKNKATISSLNGDMYSPLFRIMETNDGAATHKFDFSYNTNARFGTATSLEPGSQEAYDLAFAFTPTGVVTKLPVIVKGQKLTNFIYDSATSNFVATGTNEVSATIKYTNIPPRPTDDYNILLPGKVYSRFGYYPDDYTADASTNSKLFQAEIDKINANLPDGQYLTSVQLYLNHSQGSFIYYTFEGRGSLLHFVDVQEDAVNKKIILNHKSWNKDTTAATPAFIDGFDKNLMDANGLYVKKENFKLKYSNAVYTFTSSSSPFRMTAWQLI
ncbi:DUF4302 domain-containing protein [Flavobacterium sp. GSB-24]|uniref:DUF4302 domain-containing protein n=1 Tax=Flavobacterium sp. GSB-24 TaxID=2994319 RepID=UPI0024918FD6|nr:DUF4302 domain-containing protein [Flavobacterium sp. GSB-24]BDU26922.1 hypothetical protein FLGSB24_36660 [Flavobacterium sp. GSB-24]